METIIDKPGESKPVNGYTPSTKPLNGTSHSVKMDGAMEVLLLIRKKAFHLIALGVVSFMLTFFLYNRYLNYYVSTVVFLIDDSNPAEVSTSEPERLVLSQMNAISRYKLVLLAFSDEMVSRLEKKINLAEHYHIDINKPDYKKELIDKLRNKVSFRREETSIVFIEVRDKDPLFAAEMANEIYVILLQLNRETVMTNIRYKLSVYENNIAHYKVQKSEEMNRFLQALNQLPDLDRSTIKKTDEMYLLRRDLTVMFSDFNNSAESLKRNELIYSLNSDVLKDTSLQSLYLINKAYPNMRKTSNLMVSVISLTVAVSVMLYYFSFGYFMGRYKPYLQILYKRKLPEFHH